MKKISVHILPLLFAVMLVSCDFISIEIPVCRIEDDKVIFRIDKKWNEEHLLEVSDKYDLDSAVIAEAFSNNKEFIVDGVQWKVKKVSSHVYDISRTIDSKADSLIAHDYVFMITIKKAFSKSGEMMPAIYGTNRLLRDDAFSYKDGEATFMLPGHHEAGTVFLSGTFNNWATAGTMMMQCDSGWRVSMKLSPGKYSYKYIVDGEWLQDPGNDLGEDDLNGGYNSVVYCYNHLFRINGLQNLQEVRVTGNFTGWSPSGIEMKKINNGWELPLYLREGRYLYKFISGTEWFTDPGNKETEDDGEGNLNSVLNIGEQHLFSLPEHNDASAVILAGTFNNWNVNDLKMKKGNNGWFLSLPLAPGNYEYKFIVDGTWITDPGNAFTTGSGDFVNSVLSFKPNHTFTLSGYPDAREVMLSGSFNDFANPGYRMIYNNGKWTIPVYLKPGKTLYKFIVDGEWIIDPGNELWEENEFGTGNSVLWTEYL